MTNGEYGERIAKLEIKTDTIEKRLEDLSEIKTAVVRLTLLSEQQLEHNERVGKTLETINSNLSSLNAHAEVTNERLSDLEGKVSCYEDVSRTSDKVNNLEKRVDNLDDKSKVDIVKIIVWAVPGLLGAGITFFILKIVGLIVF